MIHPIPDETSVQALTRIGALAEHDIHPANVSQGALWLAKWTDPGLNLAPYHRHLNALVDETRAYIADDRDDQKLVLDAARQILARRYGYCGWSDPGEQDSCANVAHTIDNRRGNSTTLAILYAHVLSALGCAVDYLDFAPRLLIGVNSPTGRAVLDPYDGGRLLNARALRRLLKDHHGEQGELIPGQLHALAPRHVWLRLHHDTKVHHLRHAAPEAAIHAIEGALLLAPDTPRLWRELGLLHARLEHIVEASQALERYLQLPGGDVHRYTASQMLQQLRRRLNLGER
ncbi:MAG: tetratricopeptide repeat protein [Magnetovibrio sp.]|nr:tetratricopeptide repeat protein [Magnetovibrio sp.]